MSRPHFEGVGETCHHCGADAAYVISPTIVPGDRKYTCGRHLASTIDDAAKYGLVTVVTPRGARP